MACVKIAKLEDNGEEVIMMTFNRQTGACCKYGTTNGLAFNRTRTDFEMHFLAFVSGTYKPILCVIS